MTDKAIAFLSAVSLHGALVFGGGVLFVQSAEFGVDTGTGGMEVSLIAAPPAAEEEIKVQQIQKTEMVKIQEPDAITVPEALPEKKAAVEPSPVKGDGSSPIPGRDATTFSSAAGAVAEYKPGYLKNPAPYYPVQARELGQEGLVVLWAYVSSMGQPTQVVVKQSSGFSLLDEAALEAVQRWKFQPARLGTLAMDCRVEIPVRFQLNKT